MICGIEELMIQAPHPVSICWATHRVAKGGDPGKAVDCRELYAGCETCNG